jgi:hypothetical protein
VAALATAVLGWWIFLHSGSHDEPPPPAASFAHLSTNAKVHYRTGTISGVVNGSGPRFQIWLGYRRPGQSVLTYADGPCVVVGEHFTCPGLRLGDKDGRRRHFQIVLVAIDTTAPAAPQNGTSCAIGATPAKGAEIAHVSVRRF